jgi:signal transduction histidine kinase
MADAGYLEEILDNLPSALIAIAPDHTVTYRNAMARQVAGPVEVGENFWDAMRPYVNDEKIDRLLTGERVAFAVMPDLPLLEWLLGDRRLADGSRILAAWPATITDELIQGRTTFIMGASHELRTPLTALLGFAEILELQSDTLTPQQAEAARVIRQNAEHLQSMVDDVIDLSKNSFGELRLDIEQVDVPEVVAGVCVALRPRIEDKGQSLEVDAGTGVEPVEADRHRVHQIVLNLLQNAHMHTPPGTKIRVRTEEHEDGVRLTVADDGPGLPFEQPEDAFRSFRRGPADEHSEITGSGIGLTITRRVVELHRGRIGIETETGAGTSFVVWLPRDREKARRRVGDGGKTPGGT